MAELCGRVRDEAFDGPAGLARQDLGGRTGRRCATSPRGSAARPPAARREPTAATAARMQRRSSILKGLADLLDGGRGEGERAGRCRAARPNRRRRGLQHAPGEGRGGLDRRGEEFLPELIYLAMMPYLGSRAAEDELSVHHCVRRPDCSARWGIFGRWPREGEEGGRGCRGGAVALLRRGFPPAATACRASSSSRTSASGSHRAGRHGRRARLQRDHRRQHH